MPVSGQNCQLQCHAAKTASVFCAALKRLRRSASLLTCMDPASALRVGARPLCLVRSCPRRSCVALVGQGRDTAPSGCTPAIVSLSALAYLQLRCFEVG